jgi:hypothetical protein
LDCRHNTEQPSNRAKAVNFIMLCRYSKRRDWISIELAQA